MHEGNTNIYCVNKNLYCKMEKDRLEGNIYSGFLKWRSVPNLKKEKGQDKDKPCGERRLPCTHMPHRGRGAGNGRGRKQGGGREEMLWDQSTAPASAGPPSASPPSVQCMFHLLEYTLDSHRTVMLKQHRWMPPMSKSRCLGLKAILSLYVFASSSVKWRW